VVGRIVEALRVRDEPSARAAIEDAEALFGDDDYGRDARVAAVQEQARMAALEPPQKADPW
jgi:hypothetical protein